MSCKYVLTLERTVIYAYSPLPIWTFYYQWLHCLGEIFGEVPISGKPQLSKNPFFYSMPIPVLYVSTNDTRKRLLICSYTVFFFVKRCVYLKFQCNILYFTIFVYFEEFAPGVAHARFESIASRDLSHFTELWRYFKLSTAVPRGITAYLLLIIKRFSKSIFSSISNKIKEKNYQTNENEFPFLRRR